MSAKSANPAAMNPEPTTKSQYLRFRPVALTLGVYAAANLAVAGAIARRAGLRVGLATSAVFPVLHGAYGLGYLLGVFDFLIRSKRPVSAVAVSR